ncbi:MULTISPECIES: lysozyme inhibitor LprI family protein [unclassified Leisingera]|uniref:lysozyme inhibitor LprI family protein n=1 Tax=unclassified Leisingera TaxID=2614906 RepID=UPI0002F88B99|nr:MULTISPECIES: lysozyme inhibitor LprI family protein [unclassified Leisingera]
MLNSAFLPVPILAVALLALPANANPALECGTGSQEEVGSCVADDEEGVEAALFNALEAAMIAAAERDNDTGGTNTEAALMASQTAWEAFRAAHCSFIGTAHPVPEDAGIATRACWTTLGRARVDELVRLGQ